MGKLIKNKLIYMSTGWTVIGSVVLVFLNMKTTSISSDAFEDKRALWDERLHSASIWLVEEGLMFYNQNGRDEFEKRLRSHYLVSPYLPSYVSESDEYSAFGITLGGTYFDVSCYYRESTLGGMYELWTVHMTYDSARHKASEILFYYCVTNEFFGRRVIEAESRSILSQFVFSSGFQFLIPIDDEVLMKRITKGRKEFGG